MIFAAVFLLSFSSFIFEVILTRVFSISQWNHLSFMVISIALFGFAASGTLLSILFIRKKNLEKQLASKFSITALTFTYSITLIVSFIVINLIPLDYFRLPLEPVQTVYLFTTYIILALPFFFTGIVIAIGFALFPHKSGFIYFLTMTGSACGAVIPAIFIPLMGEENLIILSALIPMILVLFGKYKTANDQPLSKNSGKILSILIYLVFLAFLSSAILFPQARHLFQIKPSEYKALNQAMMHPDTYITQTDSSIRGRVQQIKSPYIRFAPGLSLKFSSALPYQSAVFKDGDNQLVLYNYEPFKKNHFSKFTLSYIGYLLAPGPNKVLVIQQGGGSAIACALAAGAKKITLIDQTPQIARIISQHYKNLDVKCQNPRTFLERSDKRFNVIQVENWGTSIPGTAALSQEYLFTIQAFTRYIELLTDNGVLVISRKLLLPPSNTIRLWATAYEGLRLKGVVTPESQMALLRNWDTFTLVVSKRPISDTTVIKNFAKNRNFDLVYMPGITKNMVNRFNIFDRPFHFLAIKHLNSAYRAGTEDDYFSDNLLDVSPQTDNKPFPNRFLKFSRLKDIYKSKGERLYSLFMSGEIIVAAVFFEALGIAMVLLIIPFFATPKTSEKASHAGVFYFLASGAGFMFVEMFFLKEYTLLFEDPVVSFTVVLSGILVSSGIGGIWAQQIKGKDCRLILTVLTVVLIMTFLCMDGIVHRLLYLPFAVRCFCALVLLLPCGILIGLPFTLGMRFLMQSPSSRAYAWAATGCSSVLVSIASAQIALSLGINAIMAFAVLSYLLSLMVVFKT